MSGSGYRRPPREHQFKPGRTGNPKGRPKGSKNVATILREIFGTKVTLRRNGKVQQVPYLEGMLRKFAEKAGMGDVKAAAFLLGKYLPIDAADRAKAEKAARYAARPRITLDMTAAEAAAIYYASLKDDDEDL
jgi:hypothetical protein